MNRKITDAGVAGLPLHEGRAELLEEIMSIAPLESVTAPSPTPPSRRRRLVSAIGAAAAVAAVLAGVVWLGSQGGDQTAEDVPVASAPGAGEIAVLEVDGWVMTYSSIDEEHGGEVRYEKGDQGLDIHWRPAAQYDSYVADRRDVSAPEALEILGRPAQLFTYSANDHAAIREVVGDFMLEVRGAGMDKAGYLALLDQLVGIEPADLDSHLPASFVTAAERPGVIVTMLKPIPVPDGFDKAIASEEVDRYQLGADVTGAVVCAWVKDFAAAKESGDAAAVRAAQSALATSRDWPILKEMVSEGEFPAVVWDIADQVARGEVPEGTEEGLGCDA